MNSVSLLRSGRWETLSASHPEWLLPYDREVLIRRAERAIVCDIGNVVDLWKGSDAAQDPWSVSADSFPSSMPPWDDAIYTGLSVGCERRIALVSARQLPFQDGQVNGVGVELYTFGQFHGRLYGPLDSAAFVVSSDGRLQVIPAHIKDGVRGLGLSVMCCLNDREDPEPESELERQLARRSVDEFWLASQVLFAQSMANCKNSVRRQTFKTEKRPGVRGMVRHRVTVYSLGINGSTQVLRDEGGMGPRGEGVARAMHLCRGHFKVCKRLFGKLDGVFWWGQHVRGTRERGEVFKSYDLRSPSDAAGAGQVPAADHPAHGVGAPKLDRGLDEIKLGLQEPTDRRLDLVDVQGPLPDQPDDLGT